MPRLKLLTTTFCAASLLFAVAATPALAEEDCKLPPDIDEGSRYVIKFRGMKEKRYKILEVEDCWVQTYRTDGNHRWHLIKNIEYIGSKEIKKK